MSIPASAALSRRSRNCCAVAAAAAVAAGAGDGAGDGAGAAVGNPVAVGAVILALEVRAVRYLPYA